MLLAYAQMRKLRTLRTGDLTEPLQLSRTQERELFRRLVRGGLIVQVRPGLSLVPPRLPLGGAWTPNEAEALNALMQDAKGPYQICGANTFNRYGFDDQIFCSTECPNIQLLIRRLATLFRVLPPLHPLPLLPRSIPPPVASTARPLPASWTDPTRCSARNELTATGHETVSASAATIGGNR